MSHNTEFKNEPGETTSGKGTKLQEDGQESYHFSFAGESNKEGKMKHINSSSQKNLSRNEEVELKDHSNTHSTILKSNAELQP